MKGGVNVPCSCAVRQEQCITRGFFPTAMQGRGGLSSGINTATQPYLLQHTASWKDSAEVPSHPKY